MKNAVYKPTSDVFVTSLKLDQHETCTHPPLAIQVSVCKVSGFYVYPLRRYCLRSKGGGGNFMLPAPREWRRPPAPAGLSLASSLAFLMRASLPQPSEQHSTDLDQSSVVYRNSNSTGKAYKTQTSPTRAHQDRATVRLIILA